MPTGTLVIDGITIDPAAADVLPRRMVLDLDEYDEFEFTEDNFTGVPTWKQGTLVEYTPPGGTHPYFRGPIVGRPLAFRREAWVFAYRCLGPAYLANNITVTDPFSLRGGLTFNRPVRDPDYDPSTSGLSCGAMLKILLDGHAVELLDRGIAGYVQADLDALTISPPAPFTFFGRLKDALDDFLSRWQPIYCCRVAWHAATGDWRIRFVNTLTLPPTTLDFDDPATPIDPSEFQVSRDITNCKTRYVVRGNSKVRPAYLSEHEGTLAKVWTSTEQSQWSMADFLEPTGAISKGAVATLLANSAVLNPDDNSETWVLDQWSTNDARVHLINPSVAGATFSETKIVSSSTALTAGGTGTVRWDGDTPLVVADKTRYALVGRVVAGRDMVYREWDIVPPWVKAHPESRFPIGVQWGNATTVTTVYYPAAAVDWTNTDQTYYLPQGSLASSPVIIEIDKVHGRVRATEPIVKYINNTPEELKRGGSSVHQYIDFRVVIPYSVGVLEAVCPPDLPGYGYSGGYEGGGIAQYEGLGWTVDGIAETGIRDVPEWIDERDLAGMEQLACQLLDIHKDPRIGGSVTWHGLNLAALDLAMGLNFAGGGTDATAGLATMNCAVRTVTLEWHEEGPDDFTTTLSFNNRRELASGEMAGLISHFQLDPRALAPPPSALATMMEPGPPLEGTFGAGGIAGGGGDFMAMLGGPGAGGTAAWANQGAMSPTANLRAPEEAGYAAGPTAGDFAFDARTAAARADTDRNAGPTYRGDPDMPMPLSADEQRPDVAAMIGRTERSDLARNRGVREQIDVPVEAEEMVRRGQLQADAQRMIAGERRAEGGREVGAAEDIAEQEAVDAGRNRGAMAQVERSDTERMMAGRDPFTLRDADAGPVPRATTPAQRAAGREQAVAAGEVGQGPATPPAQPPTVPGGPEVVRRPGGLDPRLLAGGDEPAGIIDGGE